jgi:hypothetical protein
MEVPARNAYKNVEGSRRLTTAAKHRNCGNRLNIHNGDPEKEGECDHCVRSKQELKLERGTATPAHVPFANTGELPISFADLAPNSVERNRGDTRKR